MMELYKGDIVKLKKISKDHKSLSKDAQYVINEVFQKICSCGAKFSLVWVGEILTNSINRTCPKCQKVIISDIKNVYAMSDFERVYNDQEKQSTTECKVELIRLLADKKITHQTFSRIIGMMDGDDELVELGKQLLKEIKMNPDVS